MPNVSEYLDVFDDTMATKLFKIMNKHNDNQKKAKLYLQYLKDFGFVKLSDLDSRITTGGLGTNQLVLGHPAHKKVVYKFALDSYGIDDNFYDALNAKTVERHSIVYEKHYTDIVAVHKRYRPIETFDEIQKYLKSINKVLSRLSEDYILVDLSPKYNFRNYGVDEDIDDWVFTDCSDIIPLNFQGIDIELRCERLKKDKYDEINTCGGELVYTDAYHTLECVKCGHTSNPISLKPKIKGGSDKMKSSNFHIGLNTDELSRLCTMIENNRENAGVKLTVSSKKTVIDDDEEHEAKEHLKNRLSAEQVVVKTTDDDEDDEDTLADLHHEEDSDDDDDDEDSDEEDDENHYPIESYDYSANRGYVVRSEVYKSFTPVAEKLLIFPTKVKDKEISEFDSIYFNLKDGLFEVEVDAMIIAVEEYEVSRTYSVDENNDLQFDADGDILLVPVKLKEKFNSYNYDNDIVSDRIAGMIAKGDIRIEKKSLMVEAEVLAEITSDDFKEHYSLMFKKYGTSSSKLFEALIADVFCLRF